jgi:hypothetical protein
MRVQVPPPARRDESCRRCLQNVVLTLYTNLFGLDIAIEALRDCLHQKKASVNEIYHFAKACRVSNVIRPYMEAR